jgi:hypothetical protein
MNILLEDFGEKIDKETISNNKLRIKVFTKI